MANDESARIGLQDVTEAQQLFGQQDSFLRLIEDRCQARIILRSDFLEVVGDKASVDAVSGILAVLLDIIRSGNRIQLPDVQTAIRNARGASRRRRPASAPTHDAPPRRMNSAHGDDRTLSVLAVHAKDGPIRPKSPAQAAYIEAMRTHDLAFGVGPAGTGKTYLAMAMAASALKTGIVERILLTRPAVEAGEHLGFLPGDIQAKVNPHPHPSLDLQESLLSPEKAARFPKCRSQFVLAWIRIHIHIHANVNPHSLPSPDLHGAPDLHESLLCPAKAETISKT